VERSLHFAGSANRACTDERPMQGSLHFGA
jgi:hypothetical protein